MKSEIINTSKQLMYCSILLVINQYIIKYSINFEEIYWLAGKYLFLISTWCCLIAIVLFAIFNLFQLIKNFNINNPCNKELMIPIIASITKLCGLTGLILWI